MRFFDAQYLAYLEYQCYLSHMRFSGARQQNFEHDEVIHRTRGF